MVAVKSTPMGPPMGGQMGPPPGAPVQMPNTGGPPPPGMGAPPPPMNMAPPPVGGVPKAALASSPLSTQVSGYGGSASGRAKFKGALGARKTAFLAKQQQQMPIQPVAPPPSFGQMAGAPMGAPPMGPRPMAPLSPMGSPPNDQRAPVQLMNGLGQY